MGFVGIPLSIAFDAAGHDVTGYDVDRERATALHNDVDPTGEVDGDTLAESSVVFSYEPDTIDGSDYAIITVPTPTDEWQSPDLGAIESAARTVGDQLSRGTTVVLESTVYPGATREVLLPALEASSGLQPGDDFGVAYSPERIAPGAPQPEHIQQTNKLVGALDSGTLDDVYELYDGVIHASVHRVPSIETAEASKCLENAQRDVNIALVNEFVMGCQRLSIDIDPSAVLKAARTKPAFHDYSPGLVGGHCLPVDPYFLIRRFNRDDFSPRIIESARRTNESFADYLAETVIKGVQVARTARPAAPARPRRDDPFLHPDDATVLVMGFSYKRNVNDYRNEALERLIRALESYGTTVYGHDPLIGSATVNREFGVRTVSDPNFADYDAIVVTTLHDQFYDYDIGSLHSNADGPFVVDLTDHFLTPSQMGEEPPHVS